MRVKKDKHLSILEYKEEKYKELAKQLKKYDISQLKIDRIEAKELKYKDWKQGVTALPDY